jgi:hypothetical protein
MAKPSAPPGERKAPFPLPPFRSTGRVPYRGLSFLASPSASKALILEANSRSF